MGRISQCRSERSRVKSTSGRGNLSEHQDEDESKKKTERSGKQTHGKSVEKPRGGGLKRVGEVPTSGLAG